MTTDRTRDDRDDETFDPDIDRRTFIAAGGTVGATMLAGCAGGDTAPDDSSDAPDDESDTETDEPTATADGANFRLLISDRPADIGDFDRLNVSFDNARIFDGGGAESDDGDDGTGGDENESAEDAETDGEEAAGDEDEESGTDTDDGETDEAETADGEDDGASADGETGDGKEESGDSDESDADDDKTERRRGFYWLDLEGATVDLTRVVGDKATSVFEGGLSAGTYEKIELHVADVEGVVDGEVVDVKVPSEKLQITHSFEVRADEPLEFVFDINVVKKGNGGYNLKPVISESGVAGEDVDVEEVDEDDADEGDRDEGSNDDGSAANGSGTEEGDETESGASEGNESDESDANP